MPKQKQSNSSTSQNSNYASSSSTSSHINNNSKSSSLQNSKLNFRKRVRNAWSGVVHFLDRFQLSNFTLNFQPSEGEVVAGGDRVVNTLNQINQNDAEADDYQVLFRNNENQNGQTMSETSVEHESKEKSKSSKAKARRRRSSRTRSRSIGHKVTSAVDTPAEGSRTSTRRKRLTETKSKFSVVVVDDDDDDELNSVEDSQVDQDQSYESKQIDSEVQIPISKEKSQITVKTSSSTTNLDQIHEFKHGISILSVQGGTLADALEQEEATAAAAAPKTLKSPKHVTISKLPPERLGAPTKKKFSLLDLRKARVDRGMGIADVAIGTGFIFRREKIIRKQTPKKVQANKNKQAQAFVAQKKEKPLTVEHPVETIQRGLKILASKFDDVQPPFRTSSPTPNPYLPPKNPQPDISKFGFGKNSSNNPEKFSYNDLERKRDLFLQAASTVQNIDSICRTRNNNTGARTTLNSTNGRPSPVPVREEPSPSARDYFPKTPFTAQFAHLLPRPRN